MSKKEEFDYISKVNVTGAKAEIFFVIEVIYGLIFILKAFRTDDAIEFS